MDGLKTMKNAYLDPVIQQIQESERISKKINEEFRQTKRDLVRYTFLLSLLVKIIYL